MIFRAKDRSVKFLEGSEKGRKREDVSAYETSGTGFTQEEALDRKGDIFEKEKNDLVYKVEEVKRIKTEVANKMHEEERKVLETIAKMSEQEAKNNLLQTVEKDYRDEIIKTIKKLEQEKVDTIEKKLLI